MTLINMMGWYDLVNTYKNTIRYFQHETNMPYCRIFLNERMSSYPHMSGDRLKQKWLLEEFPRWIQERVILPSFVV